MKKIVYIATAALLSISLQAQIKVWAGGNISAGSTSASPASGSKLQVIGNSLFTATSSSIGSAAYIRGLNGYSRPTTPDYTWYNNDQTGFFHPANGIVGFTSSGTEGMRLTTYGLLIGDTTDNVGRLAVHGGTNLLTTQLWSHFTFDGGTAVQLNVDRANTHAVMIYNTSVSTTSPTFYIQGTGDVTGKSFTSTSDKTLKENIDTLHDPLIKLKQLRGVTYNFKQSVTGLTTNKKEIGLLAQDVEQVLPEVVYTNDHGIKGIAYGNIVALLIEGMKEQDKKITQLQNDLLTCCKNKTGNRNIQQDTTNNSIGQRTLNDNQAANGGQTTSAKLYQNNPNPFTQTTIVKCFVPQTSQSASLLIFDLNGSLKKTIAINSKGEVNTTINGRELISGMYYYTLLIDGQEVDTKKMILTE